MDVYKSVAEYKKQENQSFGYYMQFAGIIKELEQKIAEKKAAKEDYAQEEESLKKAEQALLKNYLTFQKYKLVHEELLINNLENTNNNKQIKKAINVRKEIVAIRKELIEEIEQAEERNSSKLLLWEQHPINHKIMKKIEELQKIFQDAEITPITDPKIALLFSELILDYLLYGRQIEIPETSISSQITEENNKKIEELMKN